MSAVTLEAAQAKLDEAQASVDKAKAIIEQVQALSRTAVLKVDGIEITLQAGERYSGAVLTDDGQVDHYLICLPHIEGQFNHAAALASAQSRGGDLPSDREAWLLLAAGIKFPHNWIWLNKLRDASSAWYCASNGHQYVGYRSAEGGAVAVRRVKP